MSHKHRITPLQKKRLIRKLCRELVFMEAILKALPAEFGYQIEEDWCTELLEDCAQISAGCARLSLAARADRIDRGGKS